MPNANEHARWIRGSREGFAPGCIQLCKTRSAYGHSEVKEFVRSLEPGVQLFEVLAIESGGNQTITEGSFNFDNTESDGDDE